jgi:hypothetical protein
VPRPHTISEHAGATSHSMCRFPALRAP